MGKTRKIKKISFFLVVTIIFRNITVESLVLRNILTF